MWPTTLTSSKGWRLKKIRTIFERFDINKDAGLNKEEAGSLMRATNPVIKFSKEHISKSFDMLLQVYGIFFDGEKGITFDRLVRSYDDGFSDLDREFAALRLDLKPDNKDKAAF
ncbi:uncharacterized TPR repeat-containing protein-like protein [Tanacetum coccineum]|uniref:Uncharacterized TPR repeat-containing protein-like protein n=1 Tax=Tanacetum coccineum TaxID=301880 RepID=A0ABQ5GAK7_9ASTR